MANNNPLETSANDMAHLLAVQTTPNKASGGTGQSGALTQQLMTLSQQLQQWQAINQTQMETLQANSQTGSQSGGSTGQSGASSTASTVVKTIENVLGFGLGLGPLISGFMSLFGGGGSSQPAPLVPYMAPLPVNAQAGISASNPGTAFGVDSAQGGLPRANTSSAAPAQITVQVQAMDSQSFLDHSQDIAAAVRQAMLESSTLNDVIREV